METSPWTAWRRSTPSPPSPTPAASPRALARTLAAVRLVTCGSPERLARAGAPISPHDLAQHEAIIDTNARDPMVWSYGAANDLQEIRVHGRLRFGGAHACVAAARRGM